MANKLKWFTHDHDARHDLFIESSIDRFGHFGYAAYFMLIELIHQHGVGGKLSISRAKLCQNLRSRWPQVGLYLDFCRTSAKVEYNLSGTEVELQIKKFSERQSKLKSNLLSTFRQPSVNLPLEEKRIEEKRIEENKTTDIAPSPTDSEPPVLVFNAVGKKEWHLTASKVAEWSGSYPGVDVLAECKKARQWAIDNPGKNKTAKGHPAFLSRWLSRAQDSGRGNGFSSKGGGASNVRTQPVAGKYAGLECEI